MWLTSVVHAEAMVSLKATTIARGMCLTNVECVTTRTQRGNAIAKETCLMSAACAEAQEHATGRGKLTNVAYAVVTLQKGFVTAKEMFWTPSEFVEAIV